MNLRSRSILAGVALAAVLPAAAAAQDAKLEGRAVLPARSFAPGPPSGTLIDPANGVTPPFPAQPVQGFSAVVDAGRGSYWALVDNGFGAEANSKDFLLRIYRITPEFATRDGGSGRIRVGRYIGLSDPDEHVPFALERSDRRLTGGDFDVESLRIDRNGDLWLGDEFGPWLLHADAQGRLLEPPIALPDVKSPQNPPVAPFNPAPSLPGSGGFEGMAIDADGETLYPMLEAALLADPDKTRRFIFEYSPAEGGYTGQTWQYRMDAPGHNIGDFTRLDRHRFLVIERDNAQGAAAQFKRIFRVDLRETDDENFLVKEEVVDLLDIDPGRVPLTARPGDIGLGDPFRFPFVTIESVLPLGGRRLLVLNDNNFPFSAGRNPGRPDDNEAIVLRVRGLRD